MHLHVSPGMLISEIQKQFNSLFPFLKIEFFSPVKTPASRSHNTNMISGGKPINDSIAETELNLHAGMKVKELEKLLEDKFSVPVQVFRKSGILWLETTMTDDWTLQQQNDHGKELSSPLKNKEENEDYDLTRDSDH